MEDIGISEDEIIVLPLKKQRTVENRSHEWVALPPISASKQDSISLRGHCKRVGRPRNNEREQLLIQMLNKTDSCNQATGERHSTEVVLEPIEPSRTTARIAYFQTKLLQMPPDANNKAERKAIKKMIIALVKEL